MSEQAKTDTRQEASLRERAGITPEEFKQMGRVGALFYEQGHLDKARTIFEGLIEMDAENVDAHSALGALLTRLREDDKALMHLDRVLELDDTQIAAHVNRAEVLLRKQRLVEAVTNLKRAIELDPEKRNAAADRARAMVLGIHEVMEAKGLM